MKVWNKRSSSSLFLCSETESSLVNYNVLTRKGASIPLIALAKSLAAGEADGRITPLKENTKYSANRAVPNSTNHLIYPFGILRISFLEQIQKQKVPDFVIGDVLFSHDDYEKVLFETLRRVIVDGGNLEDKVRKAFSSQQLNVKNISYMLKHYLQNVTSLYAVDDGCDDIISPHDDAFLLLLILLQNTLLYTRGTYGLFDAAHPYLKDDCDARNVLLKSFIITRWYPKLSKSLQTASPSMLRDIVGTQNGRSSSFEEHTGWLNKHGIRLTETEWKRIVDRTDAYLLL